ncbi:MAG: right-handed parallel beta-helix repeat-containing protein [Thermoplasmatota archaeon]
MRITLILLAAVIVTVPYLATAYEASGPSGTGSVPDPLRTPTATLDVCLLKECAYHDIQSAVDAAPAGALVRVWPGYYQASGPGEALVAIDGKHDLTIRGMGDGSNDVVLDAHFLTDYGVYGDAADGLVLQNFDVWHAHEHGIFVNETDGVWLDHVRGFMSSSYELFYFNTDHGVMRDCEAVGAGDAGIYIGAAPAVGRVTIDVENCHSHHNVLGFSGTDGNYVLLHDNVFDDNAAGVVFDSETDHPYYPQRGATVEHNLIANNNFDVYDGICDANGCSDIRPESLESIIIPVGVGLFFPSNNLNTVEENTFSHNDRAATWLSSGQGLVAGPVLDDPHALPFLSSGNRFLNNTLDANRVDFMWDGLGTGNCYEGNTRTDGAAPTTDGAVLPPCTMGFASGVPAIKPDEDMPVIASAPNLADDVALASLVTINGPDGDHPICHYMGGLEPCTGGEFEPSTSWPTHAKNQPDGEQPPPMPPTCGPDDDPSCWE